MKHLNLLAVVSAALLFVACADAPTRPSERTPRALADASVTVAAPLSFRQVSAGYQHTCGVTTSNVAYCWGANGFGEVGDGTSRNIRTRPVRVAGALSFREVAAGLSYTCGVTTDDVAYCWGENEAGQLGDGTVTDRSVPTRVEGGLAFRQVNASAGEHACGVTTDGVAYCWGLNISGELGVGTNQGPEGCPIFGAHDRTACSKRPVRVTGGLTFRLVNGGTSHTCGITTSGATYCWGYNGAGELGSGISDGPEDCNPDPNFVSPCSTSPFQVVGSLVFRQVNGGVNATCGVTRSNVAYCWGAGPLGDNTSNGSTRPVRVTGGLAFSRVNAGGGHSCGVTTGSVAYCWGVNLDGELGDGTTTDRFSPVRVAGGLAFRAVASNWFHTCGITTAARAYCWGDNEFGQVGDGASGNVRTRPAAVLSP
jgi:alpha-tubulin suppressor-like RCC1 family protein